MEQHNNSSLLKNYNRLPIEFVKGEGAFLFDTKGKKYLDFLSGIAVTSFGHAHPQLTKAVHDQVDKIWHTSNLFEISLQEQVAQKLTEQSKLAKVFFCNSGTEANEAAIKFARKFGKGKSTIITALGGFHGRTMGSLSASAQYKLWQGFFPLTPGFTHVPYDDIAAINDSINSDTVAIMIEPIQGENGVIVPSKDYLKKLRAICDANDLLLIIDEVQTGIGRTGKYFAYQWTEIKPDIVTIAKGIANGLPLGAVICSEKVAEVIQPGDHGSTFGGNPVSLAAALAVTELLTDDVLNKIQQLGESLLTGIKNLQLEKVTDVRGCGLMIGVEFDASIQVKDLMKELLENGVVTGTSGNNTLRLLPPFVINQKEIDLFLLTLSKVVDKFRKAEVKQLQSVQ
ncbi:MAG: aspartate aminotransferase family protein [Ignavibacteriaceae bacterium]|nr:aspartate aminotransferase family protein [Ignavibacteriaceae bacterium]